MPYRRLVSRALVAGLTLTLVVGCSSSSDDNSATPAIPNVRLTKAQRAHVQFYTVVPVGYRQKIEAPGTVDFDNDQATSVVSPFTGPVTRIFVALGQHVVKGQPLALVQSADYATAIGAYRKAVVTAANARRLASADRDLAAHNGISAREAAQAQTDAASAEADRQAALQALAALGGGRGPVQIGRNGGAVIRAPIAGTIVDRPVTPGQLLQAGTTPIVTIANLSRVWVLAQIPAGDLAAIGLRDPAEVDAGTGIGTYHGIVDNISASVD